MIGYSTESRGFKVLNLESKTEIFLRDVTFDESFDNTPSSTIEDSTNPLNHIFIQRGEAKKKLTTTSIRFVKMLML